MTSVSNDEAKALYPNGWKELKPYLRVVPQPTAPTMPTTSAGDEAGR